MSFLTVVSLLILLAMVVAGVIVLLRRHGNLSPYLSAADKSLVHVKWHEVERKMQKGGQTNFRQAILEADKLVDYCLKELGTRGETMGERLRHGQKRFSDYQGLWTAHKVRNQLVHELDRDILSFEAKKTIERFRTALTDLGAL